MLGDELAATMITIAIPLMTSIYAKRSLFPCVIFYCLFLPDKKSLLGGTVTHPLEPVLSSAFMAGKLLEGRMAVKPEDRRPVGANCAELYVTEGNALIVA